MKTQKIVIAGGAGFLGKNLIEYFQDKDHQLVMLTRGQNEVRHGIQFIHWDGQSLGNWTKALEEADVLINLSGKSVDCRYTEANKAEIYGSRLDTTRVLGLALIKAKNGPKVWLNAASATIYRHTEDRAMTEKNGDYGHGFSVDVCQKWERMFYSFDLPSVRKVALRTTIVLGTEGSAFQPLSQLARVGLGGRQGNGRQMFSWIHVYDFCRAVDFLIHQNTLEGPVNIGSTNAVSNAQLMATLRASLGIDFHINLKKWMLEIGALLIRTQPELVLKSRWIDPEKLRLAGFQWEFPTIDKAVNDLLVHKLFQPIQAEI